MIYIVKNQIKLFGVGTQKLESIVKSSSTITVRMDLRKFKTNSSDVVKKETTILEGEIIGTSSYVDLSLEILPESYLKTEKGELWLLNTLQNGFFRNKSMFGIPRT